jgi:tetratricopeptide (TPR) repeat protein
MTTTNEMNPNEMNPLGHAALHDARLRVRRSYVMIEELERLLKLVPIEAERYYGQAVAMFVLGRVQEAIMNLNLAIKADPDHLPALQLLSQTLLKLGEYKKAAIILEKVLSHEPDNLTAITSLCLAYHCLDKKGKEMAKDSILQTIAPDLLENVLRR